MMEITVTFPGNKRVDASIGGHHIATDQPTSAGGDDMAAGPFDLYMASLATCAGYYVLAFCQARGIPTDGLGLRQVVESDAATKLPSRVTVHIHLPDGFPAEYRHAVAIAAEACKVKRSLNAPPQFQVVTE